jgi:hypothetical protein
MTTRGVGTIVFVGPTLPAAEAARLLPGAEIRPPVAVGEVYGLIRRRGGARTAPLRRLAIIDGYFERMAAVWHKELLLALEQGIEVWGASSMGALRAAELHPFGMRGVGEVFEAFRTGELCADDEVAVAHLPAEAGYRAVSDALVNLRFGIRTAPGLVARVRARLLALAQSRFYRDRSWAQLVADGRADGLPAVQLDRLAAWTKPDVKRSDAIALLAALRRARPRTPPRLRVPRTWALRQLRAPDR